VDEWQSAGTRTHPDCVLLGIFQYLARIKRPAHDISFRKYQLLYGPPQRALFFFSSMRFHLLGGLGPFKDTQAVLRAITSYGTVCFVRVGHHAELPLPRIQRPELGQPRKRNRRLHSGPTGRKARHHLGTSQPSAVDAEHPVVGRWTLPGPANGNRITVVTTLS
jgi:hypothetical protein